MGSEFLEIPKGLISNEFGGINKEVLKNFESEGWKIFSIRNGKVTLKMGESEMNTEEKQAYMYTKISSLPEIKRIVMKYKNGDKITLEIKNSFEKMRIISHALQYKKKELRTFIIPLYSNIKDYTEFQNVIFIELMSPVKRFTQEMCGSTIKTRDLMFNIEGVISLEIQF